MLFIALKAIVVQIGIIAILMFPKWLQAQPCQIEWQNEISLQDGRVNLQGGNGSFRSPNKVICTLMYIQFS